MENTLRKIETASAFLCLDGIPMDIEANDIQFAGHPGCFLIPTWKAFTKLLMMQMRGKRFHFIDSLKRRASADLVLLSVETIRLYENDSLVCTFKPAPPKGFLERFGF